MEKIIISVFVVRRGMTHSIIIKGNFCQQKADLILGSHYKRRTKSMRMFLNNLLSRVFITKFCKRSTH